MADRLKELLAKVQEWWNKYTTKQKSIFVIIAAAVIFTFVIIIYVFSRPQYKTIVTCETAAEASTVVDTLTAAGIDYQNPGNGLVISVREEQWATANLALGAAGIMPDGVPKLSDFVNGSMSTTAADKEKSYKEYMEKKLVDDFTALSAVKSAKVNLNVPVKNGTLIQNEQEGSAYIQLELDGTFTSANAANLAKCAATYLGNSSTANITIIDYDSNLLFSGGDDYSTAGIANSMQELQHQAEAMMETQVRRALIGTYQFDNVVVASHLIVDYSDYEETVSEYYANPDRTEGMLAHQDLYESENEDGVGGVPGTDSNGEDLPTYMFENGSNSSSATTESSTDYLPNQSIKNKTTPAGAIDYVQSSMAITMLAYRELTEEEAQDQGLLDGITWEEYKAANSADRKMEVDPELYSMAANATGISQDNITILAYETPIFYDKEGLNVEWTNVLSIVMLLVILGLLAFVVLRSMQTKSNVSEAEELSVEELLQSTPESELEDIDVEAKSETRKMIEKFVDENPESAAALLRNWLNEDWA
ncbi:MAG: flagellar M-ring protein FliF [Acetatifactor sp.]|nr:flagellar M-ring protein FliF [Acetatifactor sp.]